MTKKEILTEICTEMAFELYEYSKVKGKYPKLAMKRFWEKVGKTEIGQDHDFGEIKIETLFNIIIFKNMSTAKTWQREDLYPKEYGMNYVTDVEFKEKEI